jgi:hypothetical protein
LKAQLPEIMQLTSAERNNVFREAFKLVGEKGKFAEKYAKNVFICWGEWGLCISACMLSGNTGSSEWWICVGACEILYGLCWYGEQ